MKNRADLLLITDLIDRSAAITELLRHGGSRTESNSNYKGVSFQFFFLSITVENGFSVHYGRKFVSFQYIHMMILKQIGDHLAIGDRRRNTGRENLGQGLYHSYLFA